MLIAPRSAPRSQSPRKHARRMSYSGRGAGRSKVPYLALHPMGFSVPPRLRLERWALTPPFHPYPALAKTVTPAVGYSAQAIREPLEVMSVLERTGRFVFCGTVRRDASRRRRPRVSRSSPPYVGSPGLRGIAPSGVRTFLPRLAPEAILRPSKIIRKIPQDRRISRTKPESRASGHFPTLSTLWLSLFNTLLRRALARVVTGGPAVLCFGGL